MCGPKAIRSIGKTEKKNSGRSRRGVLADIQNNNFTKYIIVFLLDNFIWTNKKGETLLYFLPIGRNKIVHQEKFTPTGKLSVVIQKFKTYIYFQIDSTQYPNINFFVLGKTHIKKVVFFSGRATSEPVKKRFFSIIKKRLPKP